MICRLCQKHEALEDSHIIPAMAHRAMKKKSPTPFFRRPTEPNRRMQDGVKCKLLCPKCEDMFSMWETPFSNQIFQPIYVEDNPAYCFSYDEWFLKLFGQYNVLNKNHFLQWRIEISNKEIESAFTHSHTFGLFKPF